MNNHLGAAAQGGQAAEFVVVGEAAELQEVEPTGAHVAAERLFLEAGALGEGEVARIGPVALGH